MSALPGVAIFCHSLVSDWNHGNAHFLRGIASELLARGHLVRVFEPSDGWSRANLVAEHGEAALAHFARAFPELSSTTYELDTLDLDEALDGIDLVLVHEWNDPALVARLGAHRARHRGYRLLFHDTHHRAITDPAAMERFDLRDYDGVLAFGEVLRQIYLSRGWARAAWTWHEAADVRRFRPLPEVPRGSAGDLVWIGNWGDGERTRELHEFLFEPVRTLGLAASVYGVRYPEEARRTLRGAGIRYRGWLPNADVPHVMAGHRVTVHVPRGPYVAALPGIPTIRVFEALATGTPLVCSPWSDSEGLFRPGIDHLVANDGAAMRRHLGDVLRDRELAAALALAGLETILARHTAAHRVDALLGVFDSLAARASEPGTGHETRPRSSRATRVTAGGTT